MDNEEFDRSLVTAAFAQAGEEGWRKVSAASAARRAGLDLAEARRRFPGRLAVLRRFGQLADVHALSVAPAGSTVRDRLFDLLLRRFDFLQTHRAGVVALLRAAPLDPGLSVWLLRETRRAMGWLLEAAGVSAQGVRGELRKRGLMAVWAWGIRAWAGDESEDLSATMAAVDAALNRADQIAARFGGLGKETAGIGDADFAGEAEAAERAAWADDPPEPAIVDLAEAQGGPPAGIPPPGIP